MPFCELTSALRLREDDIRVECFRKLPRHVSARAKIICEGEVRRLPRPAPKDKPGSSAAAAAGSDASASYPAANVGAAERAENPPEAELNPYEADAEAAEAAASLEAEQRALRGLRAGLSNWHDAYRGDCVYRRSPRFRSAGHEIAQGALGLRLMY